MCLLVGLCPQFSIPFSKASAVWQLRRVEVDGGHHLPRVVAVWARGAKKRPLRERKWSLSTTDRTGILRLEERRRAAGLDPELRERSCTDVSLDPAVTRGILLGGEAPDPRKRGSAGATPSGMPAKPREGEGVRRGKGRLRSSRRCCSESVGGRKAGTAVLPSPCLDMRSTHTFMSGDLISRTP